MRMVAANEEGFGNKNEILKDINCHQRADCWFSVWRGSCVESHQVTMMLDSCIVKLRGRNAKEKLRRAIHCIVTNALDAYLRERLHDGASGRVAVKLSDGSWTLPKLPPECKLNKSRWVGAKPLRHALRLLEGEGWVQTQKGYWSGSSSKRKGKVTTYSAADKLIELSRVHRLNALPPLNEPGANAAIRQVSSVCLLKPTLLEAQAIESPMQLGHLRMSKKASGPLADDIELITSSQVISSTTPELKRRYSELAHFNKVNTQHLWLQTWPGYNYLGHQLPGTKTTRIQPDALTYNRVFLRGRLDKGGRYYSVVSSVPRQHRLYITANGERLVELDFRALHPRMLYDLNGQPLPTGDLYDVGLPIEHRPLVKCLLLLLINLQKDKGMRSILGALNGFHGKSGLWGVSLRKLRAEDDHASLLGILAEKQSSPLPERWPAEQVKRAIAAIKVKHAAIEQHFFSDAGVYLQYLDSQIAGLIASEFAAARIPLLILHDGFFTVQSAEVMLRNQMLEAYSKVVGRDLPNPEISRKQGVVHGPL